MSNIDLKGAFDRAQRLRDNGKVAEALLLYRDIATLSEEEKNFSQAADAFHMAGDAIKMTIRRGEESKFREASGYFGKAYALFGSIGRKDRQGAVLRDIAIAADRVGRVAVALESFQRSIQFLSEAEDVAELAITYDKLGLHFTRNKQPDQGLPYVEKALDLLRQTPTHGFYKATTLLDRAVTLLALKKYEASLRDAEEALGWFEADHDGPTYDVRRAQCTGLIAYVCQQIGDEKRWKQSAKEADRLLKKLDSEVGANVEADLELWTSL